MSPYIITTDSFCDLPADYIKEHNLFIQESNYLLGDELYGKDRQLDGATFYARMRGGEMPTTNAINPAELSDGLRPFLEQGFDILHLAFSSGLSSTYQNAVLASEDLKESFPERTITVIDSKAASLGQGFFVHHALKLQQAGKSLDEVTAWALKYRDHCCHEFTVNDLFHLHRGGRVSKLSAIIGTMISLKPVLHVNPEGKLIMRDKVRGRKKSLIALVDKMEQTMKGYDEYNDTIFISHGDCLEDAQFVADLIKERFGINQFVINYVSPTIGSHSGPGTVALFYMGTTKEA